MKITPGDDSTGPSRLRGSGREQREEPAGQGTGVFWGRRSEIEGNPGAAWSAPAWSRGGVEGGIVGPMKV